MGINCILFRFILLHRHGPAIAHSSILTTMNRDGLKQHYKVSPYRRHTYFSTSLTLPFNKTPRDKLDGGWAASISQAAMGSKWSWFLLISWGFLLTNLFLAKWKWEKIFSWLNNATFTNTDGNWKSCQKCHKLLYKEKNLIRALRPTSKYKPYIPTTGSKNPVREALLW